MKTWHFVTVEVLRHAKLLTWLRAIQERRGVTLGVRGLTDGEADVGGHGRTLRSSAAMVAVLATLVACSDSGVDAQPGGSASGPPQSTMPSSTVSIDPAALPAVQAYASFITATQNAQRRPFGKDDTPPVNADVARYAFDPMLAQSKAYIWGLKLQGVEFRGTPPKSHVSVTSVDLEASPWPTIVLSDCLTGGKNWAAHNAKSGAALPTTTPSVAPPYQSTVTVIRHENRWGVKEIKLDKSRTCSA